MRINQFHSGIAVGDAISNQIFLIQKILIKNGFESEVYVEYIPENLKNKVKNIKNYKGDEDSILIIHHSMGTNVFDRVTSLKDRKILIYHNITPERFFSDKNIIKYIRIGLKQTEKYKEFVNCVIADSNFNRQDLIHMGYDSNIDVLPVQISLDRFDKVTSNKEIVDKYKTSKNILFVGRVVGNKRQVDVVKAFAVYHNHFDEHSKLFIVGDNSMPSYVDEISYYSKKYGIENDVFVTGKVSEEDLKAYYEIADVFLCMSEHEGFGVPLLEAMKMHVPVLAYRASAVPETMHGAGIVFRQKNYAYIGALIDEVISNVEFKNRIIQRQNTRIKELENTDTERIILNAIHNVMDNKPRKRTIQIQGPFESSYSLAIVNRKLAEALDTYGESDVSIYCTEGPGDYEPKEEDLLDKPLATKLWKKSKKVVYPDITIRNMYPPRVYDVNGGLNFQAFAWEESVIPNEYIINFNTYLNGIGTTSNYVTDKLIECGLRIPAKTIGNGVKLCNNFDNIAPFPLKTKKKIRFLHISSAFPRKGVDILLKGYYEAFSSEDDVCLVLKTFPNPHNNVDELLRQLNLEYKNPPEIEWINRDLTNNEICSLYKAADCYVSVARGEGFGLPVAEAMLAKTPVIVSPNSGMADFCNEETALLVNYVLVPAHTHLTELHNNGVSMWAESDYIDLAKKFIYFVENKEADIIKQKVDAAFKLISSEYSWDAVAKRWEAFINSVEKKQYKPKVAMITTWNTKCGIAEYTKMCVQASCSNIQYTIYPNYGEDLICADEEYVEPRLWGSVFKGDLDALINSLKASNSDIIHFQFNFGFFKLSELSKAIVVLSQSKKIILTLHKTEDSLILEKKVSLRSIVKELNLCSRIIVHQDKDVKLLVSYGVKREIVMMLPLGQVQYPDIDSYIRKKQLHLDSSLVIGSYGFFLPHKGIKEMIMALPKIMEKYPDVVYMPVCALHQAQESKDYFKECLSVVDKLNLKKHVKFITEFLPNETSMKYLQACDIMSMAYGPTGESASGAIRFCLATYRPIITTKQPIFEEFSRFTYQIDKCDSFLIAKAVDKLLCDDRQKYIDAVKSYTKETSWYNTGKKMYDIYCEVLDK